MLADTREVSTFLSTRTGYGYSVPGRTRARMKILSKLNLGVVGQSPELSALGDYIDALGSADQRTVRDAIREACKELS